MIGHQLELNIGSIPVEIILTPAQTYLTCDCPARQTCGASGANGANAQRQRIEHGKALDSAIRSGMQGLHGILISGSSSCSGNVRIENGDLDVLRVAAAHVKFL